MDGAVLGLLRALLGLDRVEWAASAAAPMPEDLARFFAGLGMRIYDVYGMTETSSAITACGPDAFRLGTVGRPLAGLEVKLAERGEIPPRDRKSVVKGKSGTVRVDSGVRLFNIKKTTQHP